MSQPTTAPENRTAEPPATGSALSPDGLIRAATQLVAERANDRFALGFTRETPTGHLHLTLTAQERRTSLSVPELRKRLASQATPAEVEAVAAVIEAWAATRPVSDAEALVDCVATLMWTGDARRRGKASTDPATDLRWQVVNAERLQPQPLPWLPASTTPRGATARIRQAALVNAAALRVTPIAAGEVVVWTHAPHPGLSSAALVNVAAMASHCSAHLNVEPSDLWMVAAPNRPVAVAGAAAAQRLSEETTAAHVCCPLTRATRIGW